MKTLMRDRIMNDSTMMEDAERLGKTSSIKSKRGSNGQSGQTGYVSKK